jgi:hypothetical protein
MGTLLSPMQSMSRNPRTSTGLTETVNLEKQSMNLTIQIPDEIARDPAAAGGDLSRRALEAFALEEFKSGHLTSPELRQLLGYETRAALDGFLKAHGVFEEQTLDDLERERPDSTRLGL